MYSVLCNKYAKDTRLTCEIHLLLLCTVAPLCTCWPPNLSFRDKERVTDCSNFIRCHCARSLEQEQSCSQTTLTLDDQYDIQIADLASTIPSFMGNRFWEVYFLFPAVNSSQRTLYSFSTSYSFQGLFSSTHLFFFLYCRLQWLSLLSRPSLSPENQALFPPL